jgi:YD repeat-containing protein
VMLPEETSTISFEKQEGGFYRQVWDTQGNWIRIHAYV